MKKLKLFVHVNNSQELRVAEVDEDHKIGHLVKDFASSLSQHPDFIEDVEVYLEDLEEDFDKGKTIKEVELKHGDHIFIGRCKTIAVTINYAGKEYAFNVGPSTSIKKLKKLALNHFGIDDIGGAELLLWFNKIPLDSRQLIGSLTNYPTCGVNLILGSKNDVNGDLSYDLFLEHQNSPEYQSGEIEGRWGVLNENRPEWPIFIFWVSSVDNSKYYFKFDFTGYPTSAPTSVIWDTVKNEILSPEKRPNINKRAIQVFKPWGIQCNYLPCDRLAIPNHPNWNNEHPELIWDAQNDTMLKYLNEVYQILNP